MCGGGQRAVQFISRLLYQTADWLNSQGGHYVSMDLLLAGVDQPAVYVHQEMQLNDCGELALRYGAVDIEKGWQNS